MDEVTLEECDILIQDNWDKYLKTNNSVFMEIIDDWLEYRYRLKVREDALARS